MAIRFTNPDRLSGLGGLLRRKDHQTITHLKQELVAILKQKNKAIYKDLMAARVVQEFSESVYEVELPNGESIVVKHEAWDDHNIADFAEFNELVANVYCTLSGSPLVVPMLDAFVHKDELFMVFPKLEGDIEAMIPDFGEPSVMWDVFYQVSRILCTLQDAAEFVHFDIRSDNLLVEVLPEPCVLFPDFPYKSSYRIKLADMGLAEATFYVSGVPTRFRSGEIDRDDVSVWGTWPHSFCPGYDFQYFLYSLIPNLHEIGYLDQFYVYNQTLAFVEENLSLTGEENRTDEYRPKEVSTKSAHDLRQFLEEFYTSSL
jgi:serine/threonine protein kinase